MNAATSFTSCATLPAAKSRWMPRLTSPWRKSAAGGREFYRRELPRLAEVEVWGWGDNISLGLVEGGGTLDLTSAGKTPAPAFDGDISSRYQQPTRDPLDPGANVLTIDIGGTVWLDQIRVAR